MNQTKRNQQTYRALLNALSRPGEVKDFPAEGDDSLPAVGDLYASTWRTILCLADAEVTVHLAVDDEETEKEIQYLTRCHMADASHADYIVIPYDADETLIESLWREAKQGTLVDPDRSATILLELPEETERSTSLVWSGPGIQAKNEVTLPWSAAWLDARKEVVSEFPLGVDCFLLARGAVIGLPRTTKVEVC